MADQKQPGYKISEDRNEARRERDKARRNSLTAQQKEEINARRRARSRGENEGRRERDRARRNSLTVEQKEQINARRRTSAQSITQEKRAAMLAQRRLNAAARRNIPCAESIAMQCPDATSLPTKNLASTTHGSPTREETTSCSASPSRSTPAYTIGSDGNTPIFTPFIYVYSCIKASYLPTRE